MPDPRKHESQDLGDYEVLDGSDTLDGEPGDDPLDRGVVPPDRWTRAMRYALNGEEDSESLDELLAEEEPDIDDDSADDDRDENATGRDVARDDRDDGADPRAGRLVTRGEDTDDPQDTLRDTEAELVARDTGIDGGGASAEEAAVHLIGDPDDENDEDEDGDR